MGFQELREEQGALDRTEYRASRGRKDSRALLALLEIQERTDFKVNKELEDLQEIQDFLDRVGHQDSRASKDNKANLEALVLSDSQVR